MGDGEKSYRLDVIDEDTIYICFGFGCVNMGFLTDNFHGCSMKNECCCIMHEYCFLKREYLTCCDKLEGHYIRIGCGCDALTIKMPTVCCKQQCHFMCLICACSIPPDEEVPCILACCSIVCGTLECTPICKNCMTFGQIK
jgi:hypothetical protein